MTRVDSHEPFSCVPFIYVTPETLNFFIPWCAIISLDNRVHFELTPFFIFAQCHWDTTHNSYKLSIAISQMNHHIVDIVIVRKWYEFLECEHAIPDVIWLSIYFTWYRHWACHFTSIITWNMNQIFFSMLKKNSTVCANSLVTLNTVHRTHWLQNIKHNILHLRWRQHKAVRRGIKFAANEARSSLSD